MEIICCGVVITFIIGSFPSLQLPWSHRVSFLQLCLAGSVDNLIILVLSFGFVGEKMAKLSEESLPVAGNILHPQVFEDEFLTPVRRESNTKSVWLHKNIQIQT